MRHFATTASLAVIATLALASCTTPADSARHRIDGRCRRLRRNHHVGTSPATAQWVAAADGLPAFCEVSATLHPVEGSNVGVVYRLPAEWNGRVLGIGGGAWLGNTTLMGARDGLCKALPPCRPMAATPAPIRGATNGRSTRCRREDFSHRAIHTMTDAGKAVAARFYGRPHEEAVYSGCSTGGRMGLMEVQRYPADYDAAIIGAPVYTLQVQTSAVLRNQTFAAPGAGFRPRDLQLVQDASLAMCDADDGLADGIINAPDQCQFQPRTLQCQPGQSEGCLSPQQVTALTIIYTGIRASDGSWAMHPMRRGGEAAWGFFNRADGSGQNADPTRGGGLMGLQPVIFGAQAMDWTAFSDANYLTVRNSPFAAMYEADEPDLSAFFERGGRLMLWHGENDAGPSPVLSEDYARAVAAQNPEAGEQFRYFTVPGMGHCAGGPGADQIDYLGAMTDWMDNGEAPARLIGGKADGSLTRPHCAWPAVARYDGSGEANDPANWVCRPRS